MQFIVLAYDGTDEGASKRRLAAREAHLKSAKELYDTGKWLYAAAFLNDDGKMIGSMVVCDFPSREELQKQWLNHEPYIQANVWQKIEVSQAQVAPFCVKK
jgi:uncharacterized protein YciI